MTVQAQLSDLLDERQALRCVVDFYACLDRGDGVGGAACFALDGVWERDSGPVGGRAAIAQALAGRPPGRRTAHTALNFQFLPRNNGQATLSFTLVAYEATVEDAAAVPVGRLAGIRHCCDTLVRVDGAWLIQHKTSTPWMRHQGSR
ncbi:hypothetical protein H4CHR_01086 [Variovorax sp. PBS-H4]|uniref:nuclear transport factor 2 family protein n=1 Tax=Variovorax sp. PBS-H4 TaxID=434008 RepID=UPI001315F380|nr:nuclear transport factor 2 family protein [Variovorax sp. PBS-H4]VTU22928.1 hypothetical protein H4CHR_01086 [Variovorax sp. PBS-H4]